MKKVQVTGRQNIRIPNGNCMMMQVSRRWMESLQKCIILIQTPEKKSKIALIVSTSSIPVSIQFKLYS